MSTQIDDGGPAFPRTGADGHVCPQSGMTLRDWFAGKTLPAVLPTTLKAANDAKQTRADAIAIAADLAVDAADALIVALRGGRS